MAHLFPLPYHTLYSGHDNDRIEEVGKGISKVLMLNA
jgi:hypothetical protein